MLVIVRAPLACFRGVALHFVRKTQGSQKGAKVRLREKRRPIWRNDDRVFHPVPAPSNARHPRRFRGLLLRARQGCRIPVTSSGFVSCLFENGNRFAQPLLPRR